MKLEETEKLKLQYVKNINTTTSKFNNIQDSDGELAEKIIQILNIKRIQISKANLHSKNGVTIVANMDIVLLNAEKNNKTI